MQRFAYIYGVHLWSGLFLPADLSFELYSLDLFKLTVKRHYIGAQYRRSHRRFPADEMESNANAFNIKKENQMPSLP